MLDGLLGRGFAARCKSLIKLTRSRIDVIRRKRNATQKFLKKDMADLLANGLDVNAYGRAEGLLVELILSSCYDFVDLCCQFLLKHMTIMQKQSECPEECQEAVSSLMFAAARFSDLPELRDLRKIFHERYGDSLDYFVNPEFSEKLAAKPSTMEKKIRLMQDMASEFSIKWDSRGFEQRMNLQDQPKQHGFSHATDASKILNNREITSKGENLNNPPKEKIGKVSEGKGFLNDTDGNNFRKNGLNLRNELESARNVQTLLNKGALTMLKIDDQDAQRRRFGLAFDKNEEDNLLKPVKSGAASFVKGHKDVDGGFKRQNTAGKTSLERENGGNIPRLKQEFVPKSEGMYLKSDIKEVPHANNCNGNEGYTANSIGKAKGAEEQRSYNNVLPPPYVKPSIKPLKDDKYGHNSESISACPVVNEALTGTLKSVSHGAHFEKVLVGSSRSDNEKANIGPGAVISDKEITYPNGMPGYPIPKPKSVRRRHSKSRSAHGDVDLEDVGTRRRMSRSRRRDDSRRGLQILFDDEHDQNDEEERIIDKLLIHYSRKPSAYEPGKVRRKSRSRHAHGVGTDVGESPLNSSSAKYDEQSEIVLPPTRSISLPHEQTSAPMETVKVFTRAASFQPDRSTPARHVHPKLPEYEDLAARFAALRGN